MKILFKLIIAIISFTAFAVISGVASGNIEAVETVVTFRAQNAGDAQSWVDWTLFRNSSIGDPVSSGTISVSPFSTSTIDIRDFGRHNPNYFIRWTARKSQGPDPRDVRCHDPLTSANAIPFDIGLPAFFAYEVNINYQCWVPSAPTPPPYTPPSNLSRSDGCFGTALFVNFNWNIGTETDLWIDVSESSSFSGFWNKNVGAASSFGWSANNPLSGEKAPDPNTRYYWRIWDGVQHTTGSSILTRNCGAISLSSSTTCFGTLPIVNLNWSSSTSDSLYTVYRDNSGLTNISSTSYQWIGNASDYGVRYSWRIQGAPSGVNSNTRSVVTPNCAAPSPPPPSPPPPSPPPPSPPPSPPPGSIILTGFSDCVSGTARVHLNWSVSTGDNQFNIVRNGVAITSSFGTSWNSGAEPEGVTRNWNVVGLTTGRWSNTVLITNASNCSVSYVTPPYVTPPYVTPPYITPPPPSTFRLDSVTVNCPARTVTLRWTSSTNPRNWGIVRNGVLITSELGPARSWTSGSHSNGESHRWQVYNFDTSVYSNSITRVVNCGTPSPIAPDIRGMLRITSNIDGRTINSSTSPAQPGEQLRANLEVDERNGVQARNFRAYFWKHRTISPYPCDTSGADRSYSGISTNPPPNHTRDVLVDDYIFNAPSVDGIYQAYFYADGNCRITETNEINNFDGDQYRVGQPPLPDLSISMIFGRSEEGAGGDQSFDPSALIDVRIITRNNGGQINSPFNIGFYIDGGVPECTQVSNESKQLNSLGVGRSDVWRFQVPAPSSPGIYSAHAFADNDCQISESNEFNNTDSLTYEVVGASVEDWLQTEGGDVGSLGNIDISGGTDHSTYLLAAWGNNTADGQWKISSYSPRRLVSNGNVYDYFASRFRILAQNEGTSTCSISDVRGGYNYCGGNMVVGGNVSPGSAVVFVDGNLTFNSNFIIGASSVVFVVRDHIIANKSVTRVDGVMIAGRQFIDCDSNCTDSDQLVINGSVYANSLSLPRTLPAGDSRPADLIRFEIKYFEAVTDLLGSPSILWREIAP